MSSHGPKLAPPEVYCRWMIRRDMPAVLAIEEDAFREFAWGEHDFIKCLRQKHVIGHVAEYRGQAIGYTIHELHKTRLVLLNIAVHREHRRHGVGSMLIRPLVDKLAPGRRTSIITQVGEHNDGAHRFYAALGFRATRVIRSAWAEVAPDVDAYEFRYRLPQESKEAQCLS